MTRDEVKDLFKMISSMYPTFEVSTGKIDTWARMMRKMDFDRVMAKAEKHALENKFPPTIAEIAAFAPEENDHLEKMERWKEEAAQVPPELKQRFNQSIQQLLKEKRK
jgi:hypothetical protein